jgi:CRP-like cAMP-binding protein
MIASTPTLFKALSSIPVLGGMSHAAQTLIAEEGAVLDLPPGKWIVREGDEGHAFFILVEGEVEVIKHAECPHAVTLARLRSGSIFGEMCILGPMPRAASVCTLTSIKAIEIKACTLHHLYQTMPDQYAIVLLNLARDMARRLCQLDEAYAARAGLNIGDEN